MKNYKINHKDMIYSQYKLPTTLFHQKKTMKLKKKIFWIFSLWPKWLFGGQKRVILGVLGKNSKIAVVALHQFPYKAQINFQSINTQSQVSCRGGC